MILLASFVMGVIGFQWLPVIPNVLYFIIPLFFAIVFCFLKQIQLVYKKALVVVVFFLLGCLCAELHAQWMLSKRFSKNDFKHPVTLVGEIASIPKRTPLGWQFQFQSGSRRIKVSWYRYYKPLAVGERWRFTLKMKPVHGLHNPGSVDREQLAFQKGVVATAYVLSTQHTQRIGRSFWSFPMTVLRSKLETLIRSSVLDPVMASILTALTIGSKDAISMDTWQTFQRTGTSHLIAISGLHVGIVAMVFFFLFSGFWRRSIVCLRYMPAQRAAAFFCILMTWFYGFLVGFSLPTQRAVIMVTMVMLATCFYHEIKLWYRFAFAFVVVVAWQPLAVFSASFWLSFLAVFWLMYSREKKWWRLQGVVFLGLLPLSLYYFQQVSLVGVVANLLAIPWVTFVLVPVCLLSVIGLPLFPLAAMLLKPLWIFLQYLAAFKFAVWIHPINSLWILFLFCLAIALILAPRGFPCRYLAVIFLLPFFLLKSPRPERGSVWLTLLDVGQGLSVVVETAHHVLVYDTGPRFPSGFDAGRSVLVPYLKREGIQVVDVLMVSHGDNDHIGGAPYLLRHTQVRKRLSSVPAWHAPCYAGQEWRWEGVIFRVLSPEKGASYEDNNSSCVLSIQAGQQRILLTGDIEKPAEQGLLKHRATELPSTVLVAPHHGSRSSSSNAFVRAVHPQFVLFATGFRNRYHFPSLVVQRRYHTIGAQTCSTADFGAIEVHVPLHGNVQIHSTYSHHHYWQN